jgi:hypothetical protein
MATFSERLAYVLSFDTTSGVKSLEKFGHTADKELSKADKGFLKSNASMNKFGAGLVAVAGVAGVGLAKLAMGALETQQNMAALEQIVGKTMTNDIGEWADDAANSLGLSKAAAIDNVTAFAQLAKMAGVNADEMEGFSEGLVGLGADFAAFKNVSPEKAIQDIRSAFSGSVEVMRKYGIFLDDATLKQAYFEVSGEMVTGTLTGQQKVLAVNKELYRQGADMIGQFGRESGELSGQIPILKANLRNLGDQIGSGVLPMLTGAVSGLVLMSEAANGVSPELAAAGGSLLAIAAAGSAAVGAFLLGAVQLRKAKDAFGRLGAGAQMASKGVGVATVALAAGALIYTSYAEQQAAATAAKLEFLEAVRLEADGVEDSIAQTIAGRLAFDGLEETMGTLGLTMSDVVGMITGDLNPALVSQLGLAAMVPGSAQDMAMAYGLTTEQIGQFAQAVWDSKNQLSGAIETNKLEIDTLGKVEAALDDVSTGMVGFTEVAETATARTKRLEEETKQLEEAAKEAAKATKAQAEAHEDAADAIYDQIDAQKELSDEVFNLEIAQAELKESIEGSTEALSEYAVGSADWLKEVNKQKELAESVAEGMVAVAETTAEAEGGTLSAADSIDIWNGAMLDAATSADGPFRESLIRSIGLMNGLTEKEVNEILFFAQGDVAEAERMMAELSETREAAITAIVHDEASARLDAIAGMDRFAIIRARYDTPGGNSLNIPASPVNGGEVNTSRPKFHDGGFVGSGAAGFALTSSAGREHAAGHYETELENLKNDEVPAVLQTGEYVMSRDDVKSASKSKKGTTIVVQLTGDIYGVPDDEFVARLAVRLNRLAAGMA